MELEDLRVWIEDEIAAQREQIYDNEATIREAIAAANNCVRVDRYEDDTREWRAELRYMVRTEIANEIEDLKQTFTRELVREIAEEFLKDVQVLYGT